MASSKPATLRAVLIDDEPPARDELSFLLEQCEGVDVVGEASDATEGLSVCEAERPNLVFVDLRMPGADGIAFADAVREKLPDVAVVIASAHDEGALRSYEARVLDYLLKPIRLERLRETLDRAREKHAPRPSTAPEGERLSRLAVKRRGSYVVVDIDTVVYFEMQDELVWAVTDEDRFAIDLTLQGLMAQLDEALFFRCHRGSIVRLDRIRQIEPAGAGTYELVLEHPDGPRLPLARERARRLREVIPFTG